MEELMATGWKFEFFQNKLDTYTCVATKGETEVTCDNFHWWALVCDIVAECDNIEQSKPEQLALFP
jgi:hypothetical protein